MSDGNRYATKFIFLAMEWRLTCYLIGVDLCSVADHLQLNQTGLSFASYSTVSTPSRLAYKITAKICI